MIWKYTFDILRESKFQSNEYSMIPFHSFILSLCMQEKSWKGIHTSCWQWEQGEEVFIYVCVCVCVCVYIYAYIQGFPCGSAGKQSACNVGDLGLIPGLGRSPGERKGYPLQYSGLGNSMDYIVHGVAKSRTQLSDFHNNAYTHTHTHIHISMWLTLLWWANNAFRIYLVLRYLDLKKESEFQPWLPHLAENQSKGLTLLWL